MAYIPPQGNVTDILEEILKKGTELSQTIHENLTYGLKVTNLYHYDLFDVLKSEFQTMDSVLMLAKNQKYKESFILIRHILEMLLYFWLMVEGKIYRHIITYTVHPTDTLTAEDRTREIIQQWREKKKNGDPGYQHILAVQPIPKKPNMFTTVYLFEGPFAKNSNDKQDLVPFYYFLLKDHYSPHILNEEKECISAADYLFEDKSRSIASQKQFYHKYIRFESILDNLKLNNLITQQQREYIEIHYNFLSQFAHPTKGSIWRLGQDLSDKNFTIPDDIAIEQIMLYLARLQIKFFQIITSKFQIENPEALLREYLNLMTHLDISSEHFWFFENKPTPYDVYYSNIRKNGYRHLHKKDPPDITMYYEDPLDRLIQLKGFSS